MEINRNGRCTQFNITRISRRKLMRYILFGLFCSMLTNLPLGAQPNPPENLTANSRGSTIDLTWEAPSGNIIFEDDFESYPDFAQEFSPWILIDGDGLETWGIQEASFPGEGEPMAYIIFNPSQTVPPIGGGDPHSGDKYAACFASNPNGGQIFNDDWMITPQLQLGTGSSITLWARSYTAEWGLERFRVLISTTGTEPDDFTLISPGDYVEAPTTWSDFTYDLSDYDNQAVHLAIHCVSEDAFFLMVDDVVVESEGAPAFTRTARKSIEHEKQVIRSTGMDFVQRNIPSKPAKFTAGASKPASKTGQLRALQNYTIYRRAGGDNETWENIATVPGDVLAYSDTDLPDGEWCYQVTAVYDEGESDPSNVACSEVPVLFFDSFENYDDFAIEFGNWTLIDGDGLSTWGIQQVDFEHEGDPMAFIIFNPSATEPPLSSGFPHTGRKYAACFSSIPSGGQYNDDWLISPRITLGTNSSVRFWASTYQEYQGRSERFQVLVSTGGTEPNEFTLISEGDYIEPPLEWQEYTFDLNDYNGQSVYIAIHCISEDVFFLQVDDFKVVSSGGTSVGSTVQAIHTPQHYQLMPNHPNPFNPQTEIRYTLPQPDQVTLTIYDLKGRVVKQLVDQYQTANQYSVVWDGRDDSGAELSSGVYFYHLETQNGYHATQQMVLLR